MEVIIQPDPETSSRLAGHIVARLIRQKPHAVLGLATGATPMLLYGELVRMHNEEGLDLAQVSTFNLDEYVGLQSEHPASYRSVMQDSLFSRVNLAKASTHVPDGLTADLPRACEEYEKRIHEAGGIDLQILGIGRDGHIGFNEPSSSLASRTRIKTLTRQTIEDNSRFFGDSAEVPTHVVTMGIGTIMEARQCLLLAFGESKAEAVAGAVEGPITASVPASILQLHPHTRLILDETAASKLRNTDYYRWVYDGRPDWQKQEA